MPSFLTTAITVTCLGHLLCSVCNPQTSPANISEVQLAAQDHIILKRQDRFIPCLSSSPSLRSCLERVLHPEPSPHPAVPGRPKGGEVRAHRLCSEPSLGPPLLCRMVSRGGRSTPKTRRSTGGGGGALSLWAWGFHLVTSEVGGSPSASQGGLRECTDKSLKI